jgi:Tol biopolymer transport system component/tetratricopeptide (TPR) repeat protein
MQNRIESLANFMRSKLKQRQKYVLMLGAGASYSSGVPPTGRMITELVREYGQAYEGGVDEKFDELWREASVDERAVMLEPYLKDKTPSIGYHKLAELVKNGYFDLILTLNFDHLLEDALDKAGFDDYRVIINGDVKEDRILELLRAPEPRVKVLKLHGDLKSRVFAFSKDQILEYHAAVENAVTEYSKRDIIICGYAFNDVNVIRAFSARGGSIYFVNPAGASDHIRGFLRSRRSTKKVIQGEAGKFDKFFTVLGDELGRMETEEKATGLVDDLLEPMDKAKDYPAPLIPKIKEQKEYPETGLYPLDIKIAQRAKMMRMLKRVVWPVMGVVLVLLAGTMFVPKVLEKPTPTTAAIPPSPTSVTPAPPPTATPQACPIAEASEILIIVIPFEKRGSTTLSPATNIADKLMGELTEKALVGLVRVELYPQVVASTEEAQALGVAYNATIVIWGWIDDDFVIPGFVISKEVETLELTPAVSHKRVPDYLDEGLPREMVYFSAFTIGRLSFQEGRYDEALAWFDVARDNEPTEEIQSLRKGLYFSLRRELLFCRGLARLRLEKYTEAVESFSQAIEQDSQYAKAYGQRGIAFLKLQEYEWAIEDFSKVIEMEPENPENAEVYNNRGRAYFDLEKYEQAERDYEKAIELNPDLFEAHVNLALAYATLDDYEEAIEEYDRAIELNPVSEKAYFGRGNAHQELGNYDDAINDYNKAIELNPENGTAYYNRGNVYYKQRKYKLAAQDYNTAFDKNPQNLDALLQRGIARGWAGEKGEAVRDLQNYLDQSPDDPGKAELAKKFIEIFGSPLSPTDQIAFMSNRDGNWEIYVMSVRGQTNRTNHPAQDADPAWSPDGSQIVFVSDRGGNNDIFVMDAEGGEPRNVTNDPADDTLPAWSPDGQYIAFVSDREGNADIFVMGRDGFNPVNLTNHNRGDYAPQWSPDGREIVFHSNRGGTFAIYILNVDDPSVQKLSVAPQKSVEFNDYWPVFSPQGDQIAFMSDRDGNLEIYVMGREGSNLRNLTNHPADDFRPAWSPDGQQIVFYRNLEGNREIYVMNRNGEEQVRLTSDPADDRFPTWWAPRTE